MKKFITIALTAVLAAGVIFVANAEQTGNASGNASGNPIGSIATVEKIEKLFEVEEAKNVETITAEDLAETYGQATLQGIVKDALVEVEEEDKVVTVEIFEVTAEKAEYADGEMAKFTIEPTVSELPAGWTRTYRVIRLHKMGDQTRASELSSTVNPNGCFVVNANGTITVYSKFFSAFIVNYIDTPTPVVDRPHVSQDTYKVVNTAAK